MEGSSEHKVVIAGELVHARVKLAVIDEATRLAYYEECKDNPVTVSWNAMIQGLRHTCCRRSLICWLSRQLERGVAAWVP